MRQGSSRSAVALMTASMLVLVVGAWLRWGRRPEPPVRTAEAPAAAPTPAAPPAAEQAPAVTSTPAPPRTPPRAAEDDPEDEGMIIPDDEALAAKWAALDLEAVRREMPDNLYWKLAAPTKDPELLRWREEERARWNVEYGKVLSNTATAEEVDAYFAHRKRISDDYLEFIVHVLTNYGNALPKEGVAALKLAAELHAARLEELPRRLAEAHERREAHDAARRAWLEQQKAFATPPSDER